MPRILWASTLQSLICRSLCCTSTVTGAGMAQRQQCGWSHPPRDKGATYSHPLSSAWHPHLSPFKDLKHVQARKSLPQT